jgi:hypothetical protein
MRIFESGHCTETRNEHVAISLSASPIIFSVGGLKDQGDDMGVWQEVAMDSLKFHQTHHALPFYTLWVCHS